MRKIWQMAIIAAVIGIVFFFLIKSGVLAALLPLAFGDLHTM